MNKIDVSALRKAMIGASIPTELSEPDFFLSFGNYSLNYIVTGNPNIGFPNRRTAMLAGPQGTGKSYLASNVAKLAQDAGYFVVYIDTEHAISKGYLEKIGLDTGEDSFMPLEVNSLEGAAKATSLIFQNTSPQDKVFCVLDSLANLDTEDSLAQFNEKGTLKNDMGLKSKKMKQLLKDINIHVGHRDMFMLYTNHVYMNQDETNGKGKYIVNGGESCLYIPSITLMLDKKPLRNQEDKSKVLGLQLVAQTYKTRFFRWMGKTTIEVPYDTGMNPTSGFLDFALEENLVELKGAWYSYNDAEGKTHKFQKGSLDEHLPNILASFDKKIVETKEKDGSE